MKIEFNKKVEEGTSIIIEFGGSKLLLVDETSKGKGLIVRNITNLSSTLHIKPEAPNSIYIEADF